LDKHHVRIFNNFSWTRKCPGWTRRQGKRKRKKGGKQKEENKGERERINGTHIHTYTYDYLLECSLTVTNEDLQFVRRSP